MVLPVFSSRIILAFFPSSFDINGLCLLWVRGLCQGRVFTYSRWVLGGWAVLTLMLFAQTSPPNCFRKRWAPWGNRASCGGQGLLEREREIVCGSAPFPITAPFSWQSRHPLFLLAALLQAVYAKNHHFFVKLFWQGFLSLNSNSSLIAFLPIIQNFLVLLIYHGISKAMSQWYFYCEWDYGYV